MIYKPGDSFHVGARTKCVDLRSIPVSESGQCLVRFLVNFLCLVSSAVSFDSHFPDWLLFFFYCSIVFGRIDREMIKECPLALYSFIRSFICLYVHYFFVLFVSSLFFSLLILILPLPPFSFFLFFQSLFLFLSLSRFFLFFFLSKLKSISIDLSIQIVADQFPVDFKWAGNPKRKIHSNQIEITETRQQKKTKTKTKINLHDYLSGFSYPISDASNGVKLQTELNSNNK